MTFVTLLMMSTLFGSVGLGYFIYGKRQSRFIPLLAGLALMVFPYFISNLYAAIAIGVLLVVAPWVL